MTINHRITVFVWWALLVSIKCHDGNPITTPSPAPMNDPLKQYEEDYREALLISELSLSADEVEAHVRDRVEYYRNAPKIVNTVAEHPTSYEGLYEFQICGVMDEGSSSAERPKTIRDVLPKNHPPPFGCYYKDPNAIKKTLICDYQRMTHIPILPPDLYEFELRGTKVKLVKPSDFGNASITSIKLRHNDIKELQPWAFSNIKHVMTLEISDNELHHLSFDSYLGLEELATLNLDGNKISFEVYENCTARNVSELLPRLRILSLARNPLKIIPGQIFAGLRDSEVSLLDLSYCDLQSIHKDAFQYVPLLQILYLSGNPKLIANSDNFLSAFSGLQLRTLSLRDNRLSYFPKEIFKLMESTLTKIDMSENPLGHLKADMIPPNMTMLQSVTLFSCQLVEIEDGALSRFPNLFQLDLGSNYLSTIPKLNNLPFLAHVNLADNRGFTLPNDTFAEVPKLSSVILSGTPMNEISVGAFRGARYLQKVFLDDTNLRKIADGAFQDMGNLRMLTLRENKELRNVNSLTFKGLHNVTTLYMSQCALDFPVPCSTSPDSTTDEEVDPFRPFKHMPNLYLLELAHNNITRLSPELFEGTSFRYLNFTMNRIQSWNVSLFPTNYSNSNHRGDNWFNPNDTPSSHLFLDHNELTLITDVMLEDIMDFRPGEVDVSHNRFICNAGACKLRDLILWSLEDPDLQPPFRPKWLNNEIYECIDIETNHSHLILELEDETCHRTAEVVADSPSHSYLALPSKGLSLFCGLSVIIYREIKY